MKTCTLVAVALATTSRRQVLKSVGTASSLLSLGPKAAKAANKRPKPNEVVEVVNGMRHKRLGSSDILVSEMGIGTQRWGSTDFNAPDEALCHAFLDKAVSCGVNLVDTAEQYPIPSSPTRPEGSTEGIIGKWLAKEGGGRKRREKLVLASKITGGRHVTPASIIADCEGSLKRLGTDYLDVYMLHWPARYSPQSNWGQSLAFDYDAAADPYYGSAASFAAVATAMSSLVHEGKIRGWGLCNDNAYGLTGSLAAAREVGGQGGGRQGGGGGVGPCVVQNDFSLLNRRVEEDGLAEACYYEGCGFMAYNVLAGGVLTGKYLEPGPPASIDNPSSEDAARTTLRTPRGRHDTAGWGTTLKRYRSKAALDATKEYAALAKKYGLSSLTDLSLRWCRQRESVTTSLVGSSTMQQFEADVAAFRSPTNAKPLPEDLMWEIDRVHMKNRLPIFSNDEAGKDWDHEGFIGERIP
jgi:aryl-alcohol dehydrogenase-like predicted oxidoreductase